MKKEFSLEEKLEAISFVLQGETTRPILARNTEKETSRLLLQSACSLLGYSDSNQE